MAKPIIINKEEMFITFKLMGQEALAMNHYDLEACSPTDYTAEEWKQFLSEPEIQEYIKKEMSLIRQSQINKIVKGSANSNSVGQAQLLNSLNNLNEADDVAEGPVFVYCFVPLSEEQKFAPNVKEIDEFGV